MTTREQSPDDHRVWVLELTYVRPLEEIDWHRDEHLAVLSRFASAGVVAASGAKSPRTGGVIVTHLVERARVDELLSADPFYRPELAEFAITGLTPAG